MGQQQTKRLRKQGRREAIRERAREAIRNLYHNATPSYPSLGDVESRAFEGWLQAAAEFEIEYIADGGAYGRDYRATLAADCNAGQYKSSRARDYFIRKGMRAMREEREDCGMLTGWRALEIAAGNERVAALMEKHGADKRNDAMWEWIGDYGRVYTYGRGGRTLAPEALIRGRGFSWRPDEDYADKLPIGDVVRLIRVVESFNRYVGAWCESVPEQWAEEWKERSAEHETEMHEED